MTGAADDSAVNGSRTGSGYRAAGEPKLNGTRAEAKRRPRFRFACAFTPTNIYFLGARELGLHGKRARSVESRRARLFTPVDPNLFPQFATASLRERKT